MRLCCHLGDSIFYISSAVTWTPLRRDQRSSGGDTRRSKGRRWYCSGNSWLFSIGHLWALGQRKVVVLTGIKITEIGKTRKGSEWR